MGIEKEEVRAERSEAKEATEVAEWRGQASFFAVRTDCGMIGGFGFFCRERRLWRSVDSAHGINTGGGTQQKAFPTATTSPNTGMIYPT
jgi:hypothetical protein